MKTFLARFGWMQFAAMLSLAAIGAYTLAAAGEARGIEAFADKWKDALATFGVSLAIYFALAATDLRKASTVAVPAFYAISLAMLAAVLAFGSTIYGGKRWLWFFQPAETAKLATIAFVAWLLDDTNGRAAWKRGFAGFAAAAAAIAAPCALILREPDLGSAGVLAAACFAMLIASGAWRKWLLAATAVAAIALACTLGAVHEAWRPGVEREKREQILRYVPLANHQIARVKTFLYPEMDALGAGYNLRQAKMALGSGGATGKGFGRGEAVRRRLLPPMGVMNDFIFCVWAEETGFAGSMVLLALYAVLCISTARAAAVASTDEGRLFATGMATLVFVHIYVNIGMSLGLVPITGLPLPFLSLGRTFLATTVCGLGIVQSISIHREENIDSHGNT